MSDQNNDDIKGIETSLRKALASEKQTGLSASQLNALHLMITQEQFKRTKTRPTWKNWLIPSSILASAMLAFIVFDRFPNSESDSVSTETAAPWVEAETPTVASKPQEPQQSKKVAQKKDIDSRLTPPAAAPAITDSEESSSVVRNRAGPKEAKQKFAKPELEKTERSKKTIAKPTKEKVWESKGSAAQNNLSPPQGLGGAGSSFGSSADSKADGAPGTGAGKFLGMSLKKNESKAGKKQDVTLLQVSKLSAESSKRLVSAVSKLAICNETASVWTISFEISKSGMILSPKPVAEAGGSEVQSNCIVATMKKWDLGPTSVGLTTLKIRFSGK